MRIRDHFLIAIKSLLRRPWRSLVVVQGVIWGVALTVFPASLREGARNQACLRAEEFGVDRISIQLHHEGSGGALTLEDCDAIRSAFGPSSSALPARRVVACAPLVVERDLLVGVVSDPKPITTDRLLTTPEAQDARSFHVARGRYITPDDIECNRRVCVLEALAAAALFGREDPLGKTVVVRQWLKTEYLEVVGVMEKRSEERLGTDDYGFRNRGDNSVVERFTKPMGLKRPEQRWKRSEMAVHVPLVPERGANTKVDWILLRAARADKTVELKTAVNDLLVERGHTVAIYGNLFYPMLIESEQHTYGVLYLAIMLTCLLMSGLAIVNTMLIAIMERSREIAIRRTEGARRWHIAVQFVLESAIMCAIGAVVGLPVGLGLAWVSLLLSPRQHALSAIGLPWGILLPALAAALAVGVLAGVLPARRAASIDPVVILSRNA